MTWHPARWLAALVVAGGVLWPAFVPTGQDASAADDPASITDLRVDLTVAADGTLRGVETVTTDMPYGRHGIYRYWDVQDSSDPHARLVPHDITVLQDGRPATVEESWSGQRRFRVARIGDADVTLAPGRHVYRIGYTIDGALSADPSGRTRLYWDVVPGGWEMHIDHAEVALHLPGETGPARCAVGFGSSGGCTVQGSGRDLSVSVDGLAPRTPVTVQVPVDVPTPDRVTVPWPGRFDPVLSRSPLLAGLLLLLAVAGAALGTTLGFRSRERSPGLPLMYAPPEGVGPVQAAYVVKERVPSAAMTATLFYAAEQGLVALDRTEGGDWVVRGTGTAEQWAGTDPVTRHLAESLGVTRSGATFAADGSVGQGKELQSATSALKGSVRGWSRAAGLMRVSVSENLGRLLVGAAIVLALLGFFLNPFDVTLLGLPPAAFALGGFALVEPGAGTRRTAAGRELWSRAGGFERILATPSAVQRFDFSGREELYTAFVPWAVAFGCADAWQRKYETEMGRPAPTPAYLVGPYGIGWGSPGAAVDSFEHSLSSSIHAYQASQRSSSSGGGFSGGGGGGGGGGGSW